MRVNRLLWTAIISGALAGVGLNFLLNLFSLAFALASFSVHSDGNTIFMFWGFLWFIFSAILAMFTTGWIAGKLAPKIFPDAYGFLIGFLSWSLLLIMTIVLITNMIQYTVFHSNFTSSLLAIKIVGKMPMLTENVADLQGNSPLSINIEMKNKVIILNAFLTLILFFSGALFAAIGGFLGYRKSVFKNPGS